MDWWSPVVEIAMWTIAHIKDWWFGLRGRSDEEVWDYLWNVKKEDTLVSNPAPILFTGLPAATIAKSLHRSRDSILKSLRTLERAGKVVESL